MLAHYLQAIEQAKATPMSLQPSHHPHLQQAAAAAAAAAPLDTYLSSQRGFNYPLSSQQLRAPYTYRPS